MALIHQIFSDISIFLAYLLGSFVTLPQDYEPTGKTPVRSEPDVPSKAIIESLRAMPMDALAEEFRANNPYETNDEKQIKQSLIPRSPLAEVN